MRNWDPDTQSSLFQQQRNGLRREQEARHVEDLCLGKRLQRQVVCRTLVSGIFIFYYFFSIIGWRVLGWKPKQTENAFSVLYIIKRAYPYLSIFFNNIFQCSATCDEGTQTREVICLTFMRGQYRVGLDMQCPARDKPNNTAPCNLGKCLPQWYTTDWSEVRPFKN